MKQKLETQMYPKYLFLAEDSDGILRWYSNDPMKAGSEDLAVVDPGALMVDMLGHCTKANPIVVQIGGAILERSFAFDSSIPGQIRKGTLAAHIRDYEGNYVEILSMSGADPDFPLNGAVLDENNEPIAFRKFSLRGACSDGIQDHGLVVFHGLLKIDTDKDLETMSEEENAKDEKEGAKRQRRRSRRQDKDGLGPQGGGNGPENVGGDLFSEEQL